MYLIRSLCLLITLAYSALSWGLNTDQEQPLTAEAKSAILDHNKHTATFIEAVKADQGTTHLTADKLIIFSNTAHHVTQAIAYGNQNLATYRTIPEENKPELYAEAEQIQYYPDQNKVILLGNAKVVREQDTFSGPRIEYDTEKQIVISPPSEIGRTHIVLQPQTKNNKPH